jgi:uncharacterized protein HemX
MDTPTTPTETIVTEEKTKVTTTTRPADIHRNASWGALISIVIILAMVVIGAFYAWGQRITEEHAAQAAAQNSSN